ncbi:hypothetical protein K438DRAFT_1779185 [Mycena galopus ATCC 62051]|nr:hypothetical protein K438DRAFT_1779185 [Mycena galopus ATCC 62051]
MVAQKQSQQEIRQRTSPAFLSCANRFPTKQSTPSHHWKNPTLCAGDTGKPDREWHHLRGGAYTIHAHVSLVSDTQITCYIVGGGEKQEEKIGAGARGQRSGQEFGMM